MTVLITGDWHLTDNPRDAYRHDFQPELRQIAKTNDVSACIVLGDLTEEKDHHSAWLVNKIVEYITELARLCPVVILKGNHDYVDETCAFFKFLDHIDDVHWIDKPTLGGLANIPVLGLPSDCVFLPHTTNWKRDWKGMLDHEIVFAHQTFTGAFDKTQLKGINPTIFKKTARVISGDIHVPQVVQGIVWYVGAPYTVDFGDDYIPRVLVLSARTGSLSSVRVNGVQKRLVEIDSVAKLKKIKGLNKGDILKVRVSITGKQKADWPNIKEQVRAWGDDGGYNVHLVQPVLLDAERGTKRRSSHRSQTDGQILADYAKRNKLDKLTAKVGKLIMEKV